MNKIEKLGTPYQVKSNLASYKELDEGSRTIKAVVNTYDYYDFDGDVLRKGCAAKSIMERGAKSSASDRIVHALHHDLTQVVGASKHEEETTVDGKNVLYCESYLPETTAGEDTLINYKAQVYNQHSIGFQYIQLEYIERGADGWDKAVSTIINPDEAEVRGYLWEVTEIKWYEYSTVAFGANKLTPYLGTKSANKADQYDAISKKLNVLFTKANRQDIKDKKLLEVQVKQLQQMIYELSQPSTDAKSRARTQKQQDDTLMNFYNSIKLT